MSNLGPRRNWHFHSDIKRYLSSTFSFDQFHSFHSIFFIFHELYQYFHQYYCVPESTQPASQAHIVPIVRKRNLAHGEGNGRTIVMNL